MNDNCNPECGNEPDGNGKNSAVAYEEVVENPYYVRKEDLEQENASNLRTQAVDLNDTEIVKATENIYYDI